MSHTAFQLGRALALVVLFGNALGAIGPKGDLTIANKVIAPDGVVRDTVLAGGTFPGPLIKANKGDRFQINVVDKLTNQTMLTPTSVHWHGLHQHTTNWADGPAFVTQCPITTGNSFLYDFSAPDQAGTFWYHSHINTQYCDGLRGPLVIYDPHDPYAHLYDVDNENTIITLSDWYHLAAVNVPIPAMSDSTLINGKGRYFQNPTAELAVINVQRGKRYRFRLISLSCDPNYNFTIDGHQMTIIEADGEATQPVTVDKIQIFAAQRYSFVLVANQTVGNYWIHANPNNVVAQGFANGINSAILRYQGAPVAEPTTNTTINLPLNETDLHPLINPAAPGLPRPGGVDVALDLNLSFNNATTQFAINGVPYVMPSIPVLLQILSGNQSAQSLLPQGSVYGLPLGATVEVSIPAGNVVGGPHPFHLHGHSFYVVRSAGSSVYNYANPVRRDTVSIGQAGDNVTIRFVTDNSGPWFLHCHIDFHLLEGLAIVFAEGAQRTADANPVPAAWKNLCPTYQASLQG